MRFYFVLYFINQEKEKPVKKTTNLSDTGSINYENIEILSISVNGKVSHKRENTDPIASH